MGLFKTKVLHSIQFMNALKRFNSIDTTYDSAITYGDDGYGNLVRTIKMAFSSHESLGTLIDASRPVIIMHGLLGTKNNWNSLSKFLQTRTKRKIIAVDARNHGDSPHTQDMTYTHLAEDVRQLMFDLHIPKASLIGHSMGGRAMMYLALSHPELIERLVVVDISPVGASPGLTNMTRILEAMTNIKFEHGVPIFLARKKAEVQLQDVAPYAVRQFIVMNIIEGEEKTCKWKINLDSLHKNFESHIVKFPPAPKVFRGPVMFIAGEYSDYIKKEDQPQIKELFPGAKFKTVEGAGHWLHSEKSQEFLNIVTNFLEVPTQNTSLSY